MSSVPPSYRISVRDPPSYDDAIRNRPVSLPPPYVDPTGPSIPHCPPQTPSQPALVQQHDVKQCIGNFCAIFWILFLISLALLHLVLFGICFKCPLSGTSLAATRAFFFLHIIFLIGIAIYCYSECKSRDTITADNIILITSAYFVIPVGINVLAFIYYTATDLTELNNAIRSPSSATNTYPCSLSFYRLVFGLMICDYIGPMLWFTMIYAGFVCYVLTHREDDMNTTSTQRGPRNMRIRPEV